MNRPLLDRLRATNFRSLADVDIPLNTLNVLAGPNGSGKSNVLNVLRFLASTVRFDLTDAIAEWGGIERIGRQRGTGNLPLVVLGIEGQLTKHSSPTALDEYKLQFRLTPRGALTRRESFTWKRTGGRGRRLTVSGRKVEIGPERGQPGQSPDLRELATAQTTGLSTLPRLADDQGGEGIRALADFISSIRVLEPDMTEVRRPARMVPGRLADDAGNLASALYYLAQQHEESFTALCGEMRQCLPGLEAIEFVPVGGPGRSVAVMLRERGVGAGIELADASFGTVRLLALLTALHEADPPPFTAIEEVDHGLHPYALDVLLDRMRAASRATQLLVTSHSPTLVDRLKPDELVMCDRDPESGASLIPSANSERLASATHDSGLGLGELWIAGSLGGVPDTVS